MLRIVRAKKSLMLSCHNSKKIGIVTQRAHGGMITSGKLRQLIRSYGIGLVNGTVLCVQFLDGKSLLQLEQKIIVFLQKNEYGLGFSGVKYIALFGPQLQYSEFKLFQGAFPFCAQLRISFLRPITFLIIHFILHAACLAPLGGQVLPFLPQALRPR